MAARFLDHPNCKDMVWKNTHQPFSMICKFNCAVFLVDDVETVSQAIELLVFLIDAREGLLLVDE